MTDKPFSFSINDHNTVVRLSNRDGLTVKIFQATTREKAAAFLQVYLTLSIEDRRKLREACA